jgi:hypothetical protein
MRSFAIIVALTACAGPTQEQLAETPSARAPAHPYEAPPASTSDVDRSRAIQQMDDMQTTQNARKEANADAKKPPPGPLKKGPAEQATLPPKSPPPKKTGPAEQAPPAPPPQP